MNFELLACVVFSLSVGPARVCHLHKGLAVPNVPATRGMMNLQEARMPTSCAIFSPQKIVFVSNAAPAPCDWALDARAAKFRGLRRGLLLTSRHQSCDSMMRLLFEGRARGHAKRNPN